MTTLQKIILITGTPGVGKTTVAQKLATKLDAANIGITELVKQENLVAEVDSDRSTLVADTKKVAKRLQELFTQSEGTVVVEGHYVVDVVPKKDVNIVFVLRRDPRELEMVLKSRGYSEKKVNENLAAEVLDVCLWDAVNACGEDKVCEIDVSNKTVDDVVNELLSVLQENKTCSYGTVDWLGTLELSGQLDEYLKKIG